MVKQGNFVRSYMAERNHTMVCIFDPTSPRISAYEIHEWIHDQLQVSEQSLTMIQIDGTKRNVFLNFVCDTYIQNILQSTNGSVEYRHVTGQISIVYLEVADMGIWGIRIANLPPQVTERSICAALASFWEIVSIQDEIWLKAYRYKVADVVEVIMMKLAKHLPSQMNIAGHSFTVLWRPTSYVFRVWRRWAYKSGIS